MPDWKKLVWASAPRKKNPVNNWLTGKKPLKRTPTVNPKWLIRKKYFPHLKRLKPGGADATADLDRDKLIKKEGEQTPLALSRPASGRRLYRLADYADLLPEPNEEDHTFFGIGLGSRQLSNISSRMSLKQAKSPATSKTQLGDGKM